MIAGPAPVSPVAPPPVTPAAGPAGDRAGVFDAMLAALAPAAGGSIAPVAPPPAPLADAAIPASDALPDPDGEGGADDTPSEAAAPDDDKADVAGAASPAMPPVIPAIAPPPVAAPAAGGEAAIPAPALARSAAPGGPAAAVVRQPAGASPDAPPAIPGAGRAMPEDTARAAISTMPDGTARSAPATDAADPPPPTGRAPAPGLAATGPAAEASPVESVTPEASAAPAASVPPARAVAPDPADPPVDARIGAAPSADANDDRAAPRIVDGATPPAPASRPATEREAASTPQGWRGRFPLAYAERTPFAPVAGPAQAMPVAAAPAGPVASSAAPADAASGVVTARGQGDGATPVISPDPSRQVASADMSLAPARPDAGAAAAIVADLSPVAPHRRSARGGDEIAAITGLDLEALFPATGDGPLTISYPADASGGAAAAVQPTPALPAVSVPAASSSVAAPVPAEIGIAHHLEVAHDGAWLDRLARDIALSGDREQRMRFQLNPERLGALTVDIAPATDGAAVRFTADNEAARALIADAQPRLAAEARAQGARIAEMQVDLSGGQAGGQQGGAANPFAQGQQQGQQSQQGQPRSAPQQGFATTRTATAPAAAARAERYA